MELTPPHGCIRLHAAAAALAAVIGASTATVAQPASHYRGFWVDTFNTRLNNRADVTAVVNNAVAANANAIFVQVRRRGDAWYRIALEPPPDGVAIEPGFDPLQELIDQAHAKSIELHAFVVVGSIWNSVSLRPSSPLHIFNLHGINPATGRPYEGRESWLTRTLLPDQNDSQGSPIVSVEGHRFGGLFFMEPGHPDAAAYTVDVLTHLVRNYQIDGLHLDYIRYPEISVPGQTPGTGSSVGYNETNVARFQRRRGIPIGSPPPAPNDHFWSQWRRDQVSHLVRRIYLSALAERPELKISAALIAFGSGPTTEASWSSAEAFWRVYQDWRAWTEEGILDIAIPMVYQREHTSSGRSAFDQWSEWAKNHAYGRSAVVGQGVFLNSIEGTLRQVRRALSPSSAGRSGSGVLFFSMAVSNAAVAANPFSVPPGRNTPSRSFADFASGLVTGRSVDRSELYEDPVEYPLPVFGDPAFRPEMPWKTNPQVGHLKGFVTEASGAALDSADVLISRLDDGTVPSTGRTGITTTTDGGGFYGGIDLSPGAYQVTITRTGQPPVRTECPLRLVAGRVSLLDIAIRNDGSLATVRSDPPTPCPRSPLTTPSTSRGAPTVLPHRG